MFRQESHHKNSQDKKSHLKDAVFKKFEPVIANEEN